MAATETDREHPWDRHPRARVWVLGVPLAATAGASALIHAHGRLVAEGRPLPVSGNILALVVVAAAVGAALRLGLVTREEIGLRRRGNLVPFVVSAAAGAGLLALGLAFYHYLGPTLGLRPLHERLAEMNARAGWCAYLTGDVAGPQPWAAALIVLVEELLFRALWLPLLWRVTGSYLWANLGQAVAFALWHGPFYVEFQPDKVIAGWIYGDIMVYTRTLAGPLGFHIGWDTVAVLWLWSACP